MPFQITGFQKALPAPLTAMFVVVRVDGDDMLLHAIQPAKPGLTLRTGVGPLPCVCAHVSREIGPFNKLCWAHIALKRLQPVM